MSAAFGDLDAKRQAAFSGAIERATLDPQYAATNANKMASYGRGVSPTRALVRAIYSTAVALNAGDTGRKSHPQ